jgi:hypothetical protein
VARGHGNLRLGIFTRMSARDAKKTNRMLQAHPIPSAIHIATTIWVRARRGPRGHVSEDLCGLTPIAGLDHQILHRRRGALGAAVKKPREGANHSYLMLIFNKDFWGSHTDKSVTNIKHHRRGGSHVSRMHSSHHSIDLIDQVSRVHIF